MKAAVIALLAVVIPVGGGMLLYRSSSGGSSGASCHAGTDCKPGLYCISKTCAGSCEADADCPKGWTCGSAQVVRKKLGIEFAAGTVNACEPPSAIGTSIRDSMSGLSGQLAMDRRKHETFSAVIKQTFLKTKMSEAEFEVAWDNLSEEDRTQLDSNVLADRIVAQRAAPPKP